MNKSSTNSETPLSNAANQAPAAPQPTDKQPVLPSTKTHEEWLRRAVENMKRMHQDEAYRLEIAKKLS